MKQFPPLYLSFIALAPLACGDGEPEIGTTARPVVITSHGYSSSTIPVCWQNRWTAPADLSARVKTAADNMFAETRVRFSGWGSCYSRSEEPEIRIRVFQDANVRSSSFVGAQYSEDTMWLDLVNEQNRLEFVGTHELGHAIGLRHEQNRLNAPCENEPEPMLAGDFAVGPYDPSSLMNYCAPQVAQLSDVDLLGIKLMYGSNGEFINDQGLGTIYRRRGTSHCRVRDANQMTAFGGLGLVSSTAPLFVTPLPSDCIWPDGIYRAPNNTVYFLIGDERASTPDTYCSFESGVHHQSYGGAIHVNASDEDFKRGRTDLGVCKWPNGYYRSAGDSSIIRADDSQWCFTNESERFEIMSGDWGSITDVPANATWYRGRTGVGLCVPGGFDTKNEQGTDPLGTLAHTAGATALAGRFGWDQFADVALVGGTGWNRIYVGHGDGAGHYSTTGLRVDQQVNPYNNDFNGWARTPGVKKLSGDFNGDGLTDIALVGGPGWNSVPIAFSLGDGGFRVENCDINQQAVPDFAYWATLGGVQVVAADFDGDMKSDLALTGGAAWQSIPVAYSNGDGCFSVTNEGSDESTSWFAWLAESAGAKAVAGFYDAPQWGTYTAKAGIALVGGEGWNTIVVAHSAGRNGRFHISNRPLDDADFGARAHQAGIKVASGDFDRDGLDDILLSGEPTWTSMPIAFSTPGAFTTSNDPAPYLRIWSAEPGAQVMTADVDGDGFKDDLILAGGPSWNTVPTALRR